MRALWPLVAAGALVMSCEAKPPPGGPLEAGLEFFRARQASNCAEVWRMYSAATQENIRAEVRRREREREWTSDDPAPEARYCAAAGKLKRGTGRVVREQGDEAVVAADFDVQVSSSRYDTSWGVKTEELRLVRESGAWRVERPMVNIDRPGVTEVGPVDVKYAPSGNLGRDRLEATFVSRGPREKLVAAVRDPAAWPRALPSVKSVTPLERVGDRERLQLSFDGADHTITIAVQPSGAPRDPNANETAAVWEVERGDKAPVYLRGSWRLKPYPDGTRVTLVLFFDSRQWPVNPADGVFSPQRMAEAVLGLAK